METDTPRKVHHGRNTRFWRNRKGLSQDQLGDKIGKSQQYIWKLEQKEEIEPEVIEQLAEALEIPTEAITDFEADMPITITANKVVINDTAQPQFEHASVNPTSYNHYQNYYQYYNCTFIPRPDDDVLQNFLKQEKGKE